jgi:hypothetical protein
MRAHTLAYTHTSFLQNQQKIMTNLCELLTQLLLRSTLGREGEFKGSELVLHTSNFLLLHDAHRVSTRDNNK